MLKEFQTISIDGVDASVVHVHNDHAYEIEYHDERERSVVTLDLGADRTEHEKFSRRGRVLLPPCLACGRKPGRAITVGAGALGSVCEHCVDEMAGYVAGGREHVLGELRTAMISRGLAIQSLRYVKDGKKLRLHVASPSVQELGSAAVLEALRAIIDGKNGLPMDSNDILLLHE